MVDLVLTENEAAVMKALANNNYGYKGDGVWSWAVNDSQTPTNLSGHALVGVIGSLCKKGLIVSEEYERNDWVIWMKQPGKDYIEQNNLVEA